MTIDAYLAELEQRLPRGARFRALPEIREHLRDAAARHRSAGQSPFGAEAVATREFGPVEEVARRLGTELARRTTRVASALSLVAVAVFCFPLYVIPENTLPPAAWVEKPPDIAMLQRVAVGLWLFGCVLAAIGVALALSHWPRVASSVLLAALGSIAASSAVLGVLVVRWFSYTASTPNWALAVPLALACLCVCAAGAAWARRGSRRLDAL